MKKRTKILGVIGLAITTIGTTMKLMHLSGAYMMMVLGVLVLGIGFFGRSKGDPVGNDDNNTHDG